MTPSQLLKQALWSVTILLLGACHAGGGSQVPDRGPTRAATLPRAAAAVQMAYPPEAQPTARAGHPSGPAQSQAPAHPGPATVPASRRPALVRLTDPGCCPLPFWSADGRRVLFWDERDGRPGVYGVPISGGEPRYELPSPLGIHRGGAFTTRRDGQMIVLRRQQDGREWTFDTGGEPLLVSVDHRAAAWARTRGRSIPGSPLPPVEHYLADLASGAVRRVEVPEGYVLSDWTIGGHWLLARRRSSTTAPAYLRFDPASAATTKLLWARRPRTGRVSPDGRWLAVTKTFEPQTSENGLWIVSTSAQRPARRLSIFGAYRWRDHHRLLIIPLEPGAPSMTVWQYDVASGRLAQLTDPGVSAFRIAAGEWSLSPDGRRVAFRSALDDAIWLLELP